MENENSDQAQVPAGTESEETKVENTEETTDNQGTEGEGQSNKDGEDSTNESKLYDAPDGRKLTADQMYEEYGKLLPEFTRKSQRLAELEKQEAARKAESEAKARQASDEVLKNVPPDVKEAVIKIVEPMFAKTLADIEEANRQKEEAARQEAADKQFKEGLDNLSKKYDGKNPDFVGIPKFDRAEVLREMQKPDNKIFDPELKFMDMHKAKFLDLEIKKALKQQAGGNRTEKTGSVSGADRGTSGGKSPKTINEASARFFERLKAMETD